MAKKKSLMDRLMDAEVPASTISEPNTFDALDASDEEETDSSTNAVSSPELDEVNSQIGALRAAIEKSGKAPEAGGWVANVLQRLEAKKASLEAQTKSTGTSEPTSPAAASTAPSTLSEAINRKSTTKTTTTKTSGDSQNVPLPPSEKEESPISLIAKMNAETKAQRKEAEETRTKERERADIGQLAEMLGRSFAQMGAAQAGLKSGYDLSKAVTSVPGVDWESRRKEIQGDYDRRIANVDIAQKEAQSQLEQAQRANDTKLAQELADKNYKLSERKLTEELRANKAKEALEIQSMQLKQGMVTPQQQTNIDNLRNERAKRLGDIKYDERNTLTKSGLDSIAKAKQAIASNQFTTAAMFDTQTIQAVTKVMDPGVTHPPEYDRIAKAGGLDSMIQLLASGNLKEYYSKFASNTLSTSQRHAAESILNDYKNTIELQRTQIDRDISSMAKTGGINPAHVIPFYQETADTTKDRPTDVAPARVTYSSAAEALRAKKGK